MKFSNFIINRIRAFKAAWMGLVVFFKQEKSAKIHGVAAILVVLLSWYLEISKTEWFIILLIIGIVISIELLNTAIEEIIDLVHPERHPRAGKIKDLAAGAVFFSVIIALIIAGIIFIPKILDKIGF